MIKIQGKKVRLIGSPAQIQFELGMALYGHYQQLKSLSLEEVDKKGLIDSVSYAFDLICKKEEK